MSVVFDDDILFVGEGAGFVAVECCIGIFKAFEEYGVIPGKARTSSGSTLFSSLYYSGRDSAWFTEFLKDKAASFFVKPNYLTAAATVLSMSNYIFENDGVKDLIFKEMTGAASKRVLTSITKNKDYTSHMMPATPATVLGATAFPILFKPSMINGELYSDGGIMNNIPTCSIQEAKNYKHIFVFTAPTMQVIPDDGSIYVSLVNLLNSVMKREFEQLKSSGFLDLENVTHITMPTSLGGTLLSFSKDWELKEAIYQKTKELLKNVKIN